MARTKYKAQFCSYCNKESRMEIGVEMQGVSDKMWYRCTRCHHMSLIDLKIQSAENGTNDASTATKYHPAQCFKIGESIFHSEWDDVGKVLSKTRTSDGSESILVMFQKQGERRLITNLKPEASEII